MGWITGLFSGAKFYVALALVAAFALLYGYARTEHYRADAAASEAKRVTEQRDHLANSLAQAEIDKAELTKRQEELDAAVVEQDRRMKELDNAKRQISKELDALKKTLPAEDQGCLDRPLPDALVQRLLDGTDSPDATTTAPST